MTLRLFNRLPVLMLAVFCTASIAPATKADGSSTRFIHIERSGFSDRYSATVSENDQMQLLDSDGNVMRTIALKPGTFETLAAQAGMLKGLEPIYDGSTTECDVMITHQPTYNVKWHIGNWQGTLKWDQKCRGFSHDYRMSMFIDTVEHHLGLRNPSKLKADKAPLAPSLVERDAEAAGDWLQFSYYYYSDQPVDIHSYEIRLYPTDEMKVKSHVYADDLLGVSFEYRAKGGVFTSLSNAIKTKWPTGTVQEFQCESGWDHDAQYQLILSSIGQHVSTLWFANCMNEDQNKELLKFTNSLQELLDIEGLEEEILKRVSDGNH